MLSPTLALRLSIEFKKTFHALLNSISLLILTGIINTCACPGGKRFNALDGSRVDELKAQVLKMDEKQLEKFLKDLRFAAEFVPQQIILRFKDGTDASKVQETLSTLKGKQSYQFKSSNALLVNIPDAITPQDVIAIATALNEVKSVDYAVPNAILKIKALPNDPEFSKQFALKNIGQDGGTAGADVRAEKAWDITKGARTVKIGVIDTGVDYLHPDLVGNIWLNPGESGLDSRGRDKAKNGLDDDANGYVDDVRGWDFANNDNDPMDDNGHGTHVSGTIGASGNNGVGITGINWRTTIVPL